MPDTQSSEVEADSLPATSPTQDHQQEGAVGSAADKPPPDSQDSETTATESKGSDDGDKNDKVSAAEAIALLSGKEIDKSPKDVETKVKKPVEKADPVPKDKVAEKQPAPKDKAKDSEDPLHDYTEEEKRRLSHRTRDRIEQLSRERKQAEAKSKEYEPLAKEGKVWSEIMDQYKVRGDLADIKNDASVAEAIKFQAALHRIHEGRASQHDANFVQAVYDTLDQTRQMIGLPARQSQTPALDLTEIESALKKAREDFDFDGLEKVIGKLKESSKPAQQPVQQHIPQQPQAVQPQQQPTGPSPDELYYGQRLTRDLTSTGVESAKLRDYVGSTLYPSVVKSLSEMYPGRNPVEVYSALSSQAQYDALLDAHRTIQKQQESAAPAKPSQSQNPRPVRTTGTAKPLDNGPPTGSALAAARWLATGS